MAVKLRLARHGAKKAPYYRIVAAEDTARRDGRFLDHVGVYDPTTTPVTVRLKPARVRHWLSVGARPTDTVGQLLRDHLTNAEASAAKGNLDPMKAIWVQGPANSPAAQGVKGGPAFKPYRPARSVSTPSAPEGTSAE
jgi:small subunit ribosomal protein S16